MSTNKIRLFEKKYSYMVKHKVMIWHSGEQIKRRLDWNTGNTSIVTQIYLTQPYNEMYVLYNKMIFVQMFELSWLKVR